MALAFYPGNRITGTSADIKPTWVLPGSTFTETDTGKQYGWDGTSWVLAGGGSAAIPSFAKNESLATSVAASIVSTGVGVTLNHRHR